VSADDPDMQHIPDASDPRRISVEALVISPVKKRKIANEQVGIRPIQPRQGQILVSREEHTGDTVAQAFHPSEHPKPPIEVTLADTKGVIGPPTERRSLRQTAMHERHTHAHWPTGTSQDVYGKLRQLALGGFFTTMGDIYRKLLAKVEKQEQAPPPPEKATVGDEPDIPWK